MTKPRITKHGLVWMCRAGSMLGMGLGLTPAEAYRNWASVDRRPAFWPDRLPRLVPMHEPVAPWPAFNPPLYTVTCRH